MADALPTCQCVASLAPFDRLTSIYAAMRNISGDDTLPSADCVAGYPPYDRLTSIYCAAKAWAESLSNG